MSKPSTARILSSKATVSRRPLAPRTNFRASDPTPCLPRPLSTTNAIKAVPTQLVPGSRCLPDEWFIPQLPDPGINNVSIPLALSSDMLGSNPDKPPDERKVKLGKTLRILQDRLPTLLEKPLPQDILSPSISLHLFPSTHPHLPAVSGRVAYVAALWTSAIAWNRLPVIGNVRLEVLTARMVEPPPCPVTPRRTGSIGEQLVVRWRTAGKVKKNTEGGETTWTGVRRGGAECGDPSKEFMGIFIFEFDKEGRILSHTIEHVDQGSQWDKGVGARVVGLADWLIGEIKGRTRSPIRLAMKRTGSGLGYLRRPSRRSSAL